MTLWRSEQRALGFQLKKHSRGPKLSSFAMWIMSNMPNTVENDGTEDYNIIDYYYYYV